MYINYNPNKGVKYTGDEQGAFLADSINNDSLLTINDGWIEVPGSNQIVIDKYTITLTRIGGGITYVYKAIDTVIGQIYSATFNVLSAELAPKMGVGDSSVGTSVERGFISLANGDVGVYVVSFIATQSTHYVKLLSVLGAEPDGDIIYKNEVEIRHATVIGSEEGIELNTLNNAISDQTGEADSTNGFTQVSLTGTGLNVFKTVSNLGYPENNNNGNNATSPDGFKEVAATSGFTSVGLNGTGNNLFQIERATYPALPMDANAISDAYGNETNATTGLNLSNNAIATVVTTPINTGAYAIKIESNTTPTSNAAGSFLLKLPPYSLQPRHRYIISIDARHVGTGGDWSGRIQDDTSNIDVFILSNTDTTFQTYTIDYIVNNDNNLLFQFIERSGTNDGGLYLDNLIIHDLGETNTNANAVAPLLINEADSTTGFISGGLDGTGNNIFQTEKIDFPELHAYANAASDPNINESRTTTGWTALNNAVLSYVTSPTDVGKYAISIENNTIPTGGGRAYMDLDDATINLTGGKTYKISFSARHNGTGQQWSALLGPTTTGGGTTIVTVTSADTTYAEYYLVFTHSASTRYFICAESLSPDDGGIYIDNLSIKEIGERNENLNAAAPNLINEADSTTGFTPVGLTGTGGNTFQSVRTIAYPEKITNGEFTTDTSGWTGFNATIAQVGGELEVTTTTTAGGAYQDVTGLIPGVRYVLTCESYIDTATAANFIVYDGATFSGGSILDSDANASPTKVSNPGLIAVPSGTILRVYCQAVNAVGLIAYFDNVSVRQSNEYHTFANAAADSNGTEENIITGINIAGSATVTSVSSPVDTGTYAVSAESNTTPTVNARAYWDLNTLGLINGREYTLSFAARHNGTGGDWFASLGEFNTGSVTTITTLDNTETTYADYSITFTKGTTSNFLAFMETNGSNDGGVYVDNLSITEVQVNHGTYAIHAEANDTPTSNASFSLNLNTDLPAPLIDGRRYILIVDAKHVGVGGNWRLRFTGVTSTTIVDLANTDNTYSTYSKSFVYDSTDQYIFQCIEVSAPGDGGIFLDNLSIRESNEHYLFRNAASIIDEANSIDGWTVANNCVLTSTTVPGMTGDYSLSAEANTTPTASSVILLKLATDLNLVDGRQYTISLRARHNGTGGDWNYRLAGAVTTVIATIQTTDTTYTTYTHTFVMDVASWTDLQFVESNGANDGGVYIDAISITEVQVNHGNYAIHAEANDTPTASSRFYKDIETDLSLIQGRRYVISLDAKHVGVGLNWRIELYASSFGSGSAVLIKELTNSDVVYNSYALSFIFEPSLHKHLVVRESNTSNDGGIYLDNLSIKESNEHHIYRNAANIYDEADSTDGFTAANNCVITTTTVPGMTGDYCIEIESNTTPSNSASGNLTLNDATINLQSGRQYKLSFSARHVGSGGIYLIRLAGSVTGINIVQLTSTDITFTDYEIVFTLDTDDSNIFQCKELSATNDGGVYIDAISITEVQVNHGNFSFHASSNDTPTSLARFTTDLDGAPYSLIDGYRYVITYDIKHGGVGGSWSHWFGSTSSAFTNFMRAFANTEVTYTTYSFSWIHDSGYRYLHFVGNSGTNDGEIYLDNLSIKESNEYHLYSNAASDPIRESNTTTGWTAANNAVLSSVSSPVDAGAYAIEVEGNTTPTANSNAQLDLNDSTINLTQGKQYKITFDARHVGTGGDWVIRIQGTTTNTVIASLTNSETTYSEYSLEFIHDTNDSDFLRAIENSGTNDGGVYIDNLSITEVQVNVGNYAFHAECNDTPTSLARCYVDMEAEFGLETGKYYTVEVDAKHVGVGGAWVIGIAPTNNTGGGFHVESSLTDVEYNTYTANWIYAGEKYLIFIEGNVSADGGLYIDNLHVHQSGEHHIYSNAAADPAGLEDNTISGWSFSDVSMTTSVSSPVDVGTYAISIESNTLPHSQARSWLDLSDTTINLQDGVDYTMSFSARHNGTGGDYRINIGDATTTETEAIATLTSSDTTYQVFAFTWTHSSAYRYFKAIENSVGNDGGVYIDNLSIRRSDPDFSSTNLGLQKFGLLKKHVVNFNADLLSYSGFSTIDFLLQPYTSNLDPGTGDFYYKFWFKSPKQGGTNDYIFYRTASVGIEAYGMVAATGYLTFGVTGGSLADSSSLVDDNNWHMGVMQKASGFVEIWLDALRLGTQANTGDLTDINAPLYIGLNAIKNSPADRTELALFTAGTNSLSQTQITNIYNSEKILFARDNAYAVVDQPITLDIRPQSLTRSTETQRTQNISLGGQRETLVTRQNNLWNTTTTLVDYVDLKYYRQLFNSVIDGQTFTFDPYGAIEAPNDPKQVTYEDNTYTETREGQLDKFRNSFRVKE